MKFLIADYDFPDVELELALLREAGMEAATAQCRTEEDVIRAAKDCDGLLVQYAPVNARVFEACPNLRIVSRFGAGSDTVNTLGFCVGVPCCPARSRCAPPGASAPPPA